MSYRKEIQGKLKDGYDDVTNFYNVSLNKGYAVLEGHRGIVSFENERIVVKLRRGTVELLGENMIIVSSQKEELVIKGKIKSLNFDGVY